ncbi:MAG: S46 family peptidase [Proteobacteria bacterium]|nr:MAG: S46 family peptidase [Pseudomonadota bacterium]
MIYLLLSILSIARPAFAAEGMWLLNKFPAASVEKSHGFKVTKPWLDHLRLSSARLAGGCSGSFVSATGLVMTNHHCAHSCIEQLSTKARDYVASGFYAKKLEDEVKCPEIEVNRLVEISDITGKILGGTKNLSGKAYNEAFKTISSRLESECSKNDPNVRCDVVNLYHGGEFNLYRYQRYQDVRLVFAPEMAAAFFGGDPDNFMFPRYDLDASFLRVYENNRPLKNEEYFRWSKTPAKDGDLSFVTGHPGRTSRLNTIAQLSFARDVDLVHQLVAGSELRGILTAFGERGAEQRRISEETLFGIENWMKSAKGRQRALADPIFFAAKEEEEQALRRRVNGNPRWKKQYGDAWNGMEKAVDAYRAIYTRYNAIERQNFNSKLFSLAKSLVMAAEEMPKTNERRFTEYTEAKLPALKQELFSEAPIYDEFEIAMLSFNLTKLREELTTDDPFVKKLFGQKSPEEIAKELVEGSKLTKIAYRKELFEGGAAAIAASKDPMIRFALLVAPEARALRERFENEIEPLYKKNGEKIAQAQFAAYGNKVYPDATFTLRVSYGTLEGFEENGQRVKPITDFAGAFARHTGRDPYRLPESWLKNKDNLDLKAPLNFSSSNDIVGGNSGSPVVNAKAEVVGLIFDGNIQSLGGTYGYDAKVNRAVSVHSAGILEALRKIYRADRLVEDLLKP